MKIIKILVASYLLLVGYPLIAQNQTAELSTIYPEDALPFTVQIDVADFILPAGIQAYASANYKGKWLLLAGRTNGVHGFSNIANNFPPNKQNQEVYVVDPSTGIILHRSLNDSDLTQEQIDLLSVTSSESFQKGNILYVVGGYGVNTATGKMETKSTLTEINISKMMQWVQGGAQSLKRALRHVSNPLLQVTGGYLYQANDHEPMLLMLGQNFTGLYRDNSSGEYTKQIRSFWLNDDGKKLSILPKFTSNINPDYRRRDLNIVPIIQNNQMLYIAFSGVFTLDVGIWTVPITIFPDGTSFENNLSSLKQGMNNYTCPTIGLYSVSNKQMYAVFPGGLSYGYFSGGVFTTDSEIPFINQVTTVQIDKNNNFTQYLMNGEYPFLVSLPPLPNPGNQLLFGSGATFFPKNGVPLFSNGVIQLDALSNQPTIIGYIVGGIMSTLPNTNFITDSTSSPYIFTVTLIPKNPT